MLKGKYLIPGKVIPGSSFSVCVYPPTCFDFSTNYIYVSYYFVVVNSLLIGSVPIWSLTPVDEKCIVVLTFDMKLMKYRGCREKIQEIQVGQRC